MHPHRHAPPQSHHHFSFEEVSLLDSGELGRQSVVQLEQEIALLSHFEHENIVRYYGTDKDDKLFYRALEVEIFVFRNYNLCHRRTVVSIPNGPSALAVKEAAWGLARYAVISQTTGWSQIPIVEPEILVDGEHIIDTTFEVAKKVWAEVFFYLAQNNVLFEGMVTPGADSKEKFPYNGNFTENFYFPCYALNNGNKESHMGGQMQRNATFLYDQPADNAGGPASDIGDAVMARWL
ncbi:fructose-bisphosphate aldolase 1, chloroplastic-like protein [Tanacetum coccineum]